MARILGFALLVGLAASAAFADVVVITKSKKEKVLGLPDTIDEVEITPENWRIFLPQSEGVVVEENYDGVVWKKSAKVKSSETIPLEEIVEVALAPMQRSGDLDQGYTALANRNLAAAIRSFQACLEDAEARPVDKNEANFMIGYAFAASGRLPSAEKHFEKWNGGKSKYTPEAYRLLAEIYTTKQKYDDARKTYQRIADLPGIPPAGKVKAQAGLVKVDIAERKFKEAEGKAMGIAKAAAGKEEMNDSRATAMGLAAQAILAAQEDARFPEAEKLLMEAIEVPGTTDTTKAFLNSTLGDALYAQRRLEAARFPYLRVVTLYPEETGYVANALLNAGNCFIDLAGKAEGAGNHELYCEYMIKGMQLISECGRDHKGSTAARSASQVWRTHRDAYEACKREKGMVDKEPAKEEPKDEPEEDGR